MKTFSFRVCVWSFSQRVQWEAREEEEGDARVLDFESLPNMVVVESRLLCYRFSAELFSLFLFFLPRSSGSLLCLRCYLMMFFAIFIRLVCYLFGKLTNFVEQQAQIKYVTCTYVYNLKKLCDVERTWVSVANFSNICRKILILICMHAWTLIYYCFNCILSVAFYFTIHHEWFKYMSYGFCCRVNWTSLIPFR